DGPSREITRPGAVVIFSAGQPISAALELPPDGLTLGRELPRGLFERDDRVSRMHARIARVGSGFRVDDLGSRNGTFVNGERIGEGYNAQGGAIVRIGRSLLWLVDDVTPFTRPKQEHDSGVGPVLGGRLLRAFAAIRSASRSGDPLCLRGESGAGKELAARAFHEAKFGESGREPFVAVNCAAIPEGLAERLLFGAKRGAYSGATADSDGYVQAAHGGTLFLDEIAELDPLVQAKLLRVLETREVLQLGASKPRKVEIQVCVASHKSLRDEVAQGRFREDLYFRVGRPEVYVPPLRERLDEVPWLVQRELTAISNNNPSLPEKAVLRGTVNFIEAIALRAWPGNVRELLREVRRAAHQALEASTVHVDAVHLAEDAGRGFVAPASESAAPPKALLPSDAEIERALAENGNNVRGTARALGVHRNQLRRWLARRNGEKGAELTELDGPDGPEDDVEEP
ncbi:MAG TPA: sigma 54-interacting transcriptional regulator, partial [Polyangiales bacterium]